MAHGVSWDPDWVACPGEFIQEYMEINNFSVKVLATACARMSTYSLQMILDGHLKLDAMCARQLEHGTGIPAWFWLKIDSMYRSGLAAGKMHTHS
jgi:hypothetical protein